ncbi:protein FAM161B-like [Babylonia areolata]|uniref:protein FAM161B-like n=1 Tax=Babylonia areolata TaxID=304850 RepID=UPI003FD2CD14
MATMATTSHGLSVYINSCVKNPHNSKSRTSATFPKGNLKSARFAVTDPGPVCDVSEEFEEKDLNGLESSLPVRASYEDVEAQLKTLTEEQFYLKLQELKQSNRKTLDECAKLYQEKYGSGGKDMGDLAAREMVENMFAARLAARSGLVEERTTTMPQNVEMTNGYFHDRGTTLSSKPPPAPVSKRESSLSKTLPSRSSAVFKPRPSSAPMHSNPYVRRSYSLDDDDWKKVMQASSDFSDDEVQSEGPLEPKAEAAVNRIRDMWRGFTIDDYGPSDRHRSSSSLASKKQKEKADLADGWRHRITIPKPFVMTMRESTKEKKKTKAQQELEEQRLEKQRLEEEECQKKFKAQPAPAHIYLPLYDEIQEKNEARRRFVKQHCKELLKSQEKPFNFVKREGEKKQQRVRSATVAERIAQSVQKAKKEKFVARPIPKSVYSSTPRDRLQEDEEYRKIRIKMRARELLREASLPPNMEAHQKLKEQKEQEKLQKTKQKARSKRRPKSAHQVPDYDYMYREFQKELARRKQTKEATMVEPFSFETGRIHSSREQVLRDMERDDKLMKDTARGTPHLSLGVLSSSMDSIPLRSSTSAELRTGYFRTLRERERRRQEEEQEEERRRRVREAKLRRYIMERGGETPRLEDSLKERLRRHREAEIARLEQYEKDLEEMRNRIEKRPLLFEKETQISAGKAAEKKFQTTLKTAGIDEEFIRTRSSAAPSAHSDDNYEDDYEDEN